MGISRRNFLTQASLFTAGAFGAYVVFGEEISEQELLGYNLMAEVRQYRKFDAYATSDLSEGNIARMLDFADRLEIQKLAVGMPMTPIKNTPDEFQSINNNIYQAVNKYPDRLVGEFTLNPLYKKESLDEINRNIERGLIGTRLYNQVKINDPLYFPIIERLADLNMLVFMHGECQLGVGGYRMKYDAKKPISTSTPADFVEAATRYPEAMFQFAHIGGGSDWECMCKTFENHPNIYVDTGGSNNEENMVDVALQYLGEDRLFFGTDNSYYQSVGKILSSNLSVVQKEKLFFKNYVQVLKKGGFYVD